MPPDSPATTSGDAVAEPKPIVRVFVVANDVRAIDSAIQDVIDASRNLNAETLKQGVIPERGVWQFCLALCGQAVRMRLEIFLTTFRGRSWTKCHK